MIIQPHLRFAYELLKWEELLRVRSASSSEDGSPRSSGSSVTLAGSAGVKREFEWGEIAREVANMNRPYAR